MLGEYFYHKITRSVSAVFGSLFNNIYVVRKDSSENVLNQEKVPLAYGSRQKWIARIDEREDLDDVAKAIKLPRMSFDLNGFAYDSTRQKNRFCTEKVIKNDGSISKVYSSGTPYDLSFELNIYTITLDDMHQILEQILPYFAPDYGVTINIANEVFKQDVKFILNSVGVSDVYEGSFTERKILIYTLSFTAKVIYYNGFGNSKVIKTAIANFYDYDNPTNLIKGISYAVTPSTANEDDVYTINITENFGWDE